MPYKSAAQQRFMHAVHPDIAARWDDETNWNKKLPRRVKKKRLHEGMFSKLAESLTRFQTLARVHPGIQRARRNIQTRQHNFARKGLSSFGRTLRSALRNRRSI